MTDAEWRTAYEKLGEELIQTKDTLKALGAEIAALRLEKQELQNRSAIWDREKQSYMTQIDALRKRKRSLNA